MSNFNLNHVLQGGYFSRTLREWQSMNTSVSPSNLILPLFIHENDDYEDEVKSLPGVKRFGINKLYQYLNPIVEDGLQTVLLFGVIDTASLKDELGSFADNAQNPVIRAIPYLRRWFPKLMIACDVCLCAYTSHGHCGVFNEAPTDEAQAECQIDITQSIDREKSCERIAAVALAYAKAGADCVAPSDMMDGRIAAINKQLDENKIRNRVCIMSYSTKFSSAFYGPFRDAAKSAPSFGNRKCYQLPCNSTGLAIRASQRDVEEGKVYLMDFFYSFLNFLLLGADVLMVKPGMAYLDIVKELKQNFPHHPLCIYQVSGEYAMIYHGAQANTFNLHDILVEIMSGMRRAGADIIISYYTPQILKWIKEGNFIQQ